MVKHKGGTDKSQTWLTFLRNHLEVSWAVTPLFLASNRNLRPMGVAWFRFPKVGGLHHRYLRVAA